MHLDHNNHHCKTNNDWKDNHSIGNNNAKVRDDDTHQHQHHRPNHNAPATYLWDVPRAGRCRNERLPCGQLLPRWGDSTDSVRCRPLLPGAGLQPDTLPVRDKVPYNDGPAAAVRATLLLPNGWGVNPDALPEGFLLPEREHV